MSGFITVKRASEILGVTPHYVRKLIKDQKIVGQQIKNSNRWQVDRASIEQYRKTDIFKQDLADMSKPHSMTLKEAIESVEDCFDGDVILYVMSTGIIEPNDAFNLNNLLSMLKPRRKGLSGKKFKKIILVLHSNGGVLEAAIKLGGIIKTYTDEFEVVVPLAAKSAATLIALKSDKLYLTPVSELGPVDPMVQIPSNSSIRMPAHLIEQIINQYKNQTTDTKNNPIDEIIINKLNNIIDPYVLAAYKSAQDDAKIELSECLKKYSVYKDKDKIEAVQKLFLKKNSHSYPILYNDLKNFGIGELIDDNIKLNSVNTLMNVFNAFMVNHNIIKVLSNRDQTSNTVLPSDKTSQKSIQINN